MCVFCDIIDGKIPSKKVYENDQVLAILDLSQVTYGHTLVMPKKHVETIMEADSETVAACAEAVRVLSKQIVEKTGAKGCNILNNNGEVAGQTVQHLHFHILPRYSEADACKFNFEESASQDLDAVLEKIHA